MSGIPETETKEQATATVDNNASKSADDIMSMSKGNFAELMKGLMEMFAKGMSVQNAKSKRDELNGYAFENSAFREGIRKRAHRADFFTIHWKRLGDRVLLKPYLDGKVDRSGDFYFTFSRADNKYNLYIHIRNKGQFDSEHETDIGMVKTALAGNPKYVAENIVSIPLFKGDPVELARTAFLYFNGAYGHNRRMFVDTSKDYKEL